jgi:hypothetical protein
MVMRFKNVVAILLLGLIVQSPLFAGTSAPASQPVDPDALSPEDAAVEAKLDQHVDERLKGTNYNAEALSHIFDDIADKSGLKIDVDWPALERAGVQRDSPVTAKIRDIKTSKALEFVFKSVEGEDDEHHLGYRITHGTVRISSNAELDKLRVTRSYDITDLLAGHPDRPVTQSKGMSGFATPSDEVESREEWLDDIMKYVTDNVRTNSWKDNGGDVGEISSDSTKNHLVILQTPEAQREVKAVLKDLREGIKVKQAKTP